jgi:hypothetical protein
MNNCFSHSNRSEFADPDRGTVREAKHPWATLMRSRPGLEARLPRLIRIMKPNGDGLSIDQGIHGWRGLLLGLALVLGASAGAHAQETARPAVVQEEATPLAFKDFLEVSPSEMKPSAQLLALSGKRVKLVGFMAKMEVAPKGAFYLTPRPVSCDEEGGGTADLPPEAVYVRVRSQAGQEIPHSPRALEVTGVLEVGYHIEDDQSVTHIRLVLDRPQDLSASIQ